MLEAKFKGVWLRLLVAFVGIPVIVWAMDAMQGLIWFIICLVALSGGSDELLGFALGDKPEWRAPGIRRGLCLALFSIGSLWVATSIVRYGLPWGGRHLAGALRLGCEAGTGVAVSVLLFGLIWPRRVTRAHVKPFVLVLGPFYIGGLIGMLATLRRYGTPQEGIGLCLFTLSAAWASDGAAYFGGKFFGGPKLYQQVSEGKTWSGAVSGLIGAVIVCSLVKAHYLPTMTVNQCVILSVVASAFGQIGDLCESVLKRAVGVKDSGAIVPGHGGMLDRIDALLFASFVMYLALRMSWLEFPLHPIG